MRADRLSVLVAAFASLAACASSTVTRTGTASYAPLSPTADVAIFTAETQVGQPFEVIANISYIDPGKYAILNLSDAFEPLRKKAREIGANGVIIDQSDQVISGIISRGISVEARAVHLATPPVPVGASNAAPQDSSKDAADALRQLQKLHQDGVITDEEYETKKAEILRRM